MQHENTLPLSSQEADNRTPPAQLVTSRLRAGLMFSVALLLLLMLALLLPHGGVSDEFSDLMISGGWLPLGIVVCWLIIALDALFGAATATDELKPRLLRLLLLLLLAPFRLTIASAIPNRYVWLPRSGWRVTGIALYNHLELRLAMPMLIITLFILPVIGLEVLFPDKLAQSPELALAQHLITALIWFAFAIEFILMVSVAEKKLSYCKQHWINIVIILLPLVAFLRTLQLFRFLRVAKAGKIMRAYRLRGVFTRTLRLALMLNIVERIMERNLQRYIGHLEEKIVEKEAELVELRQKLHEAKIKLEQCDN